MEFCPKCGTLLMMKKARFGCPRCNYSAKEKVDMEIKEEINDKVVVAVVNEKEADVYPITDYNCRKCKHKKAYFWIRQMRAGDEPESKFYKCVKCKNVVRVDD
ncbi:transcription factor S [Candidatus Pacearchaeota archaeon]|nr:transcription factor S [Candidatus Pacearchaeota archaeon]